MLRRLMSRNNINRQPELAPDEEDKVISNLDLMPFRNLHFRALVSSSISVSFYQRQKTQPSHEKEKKSKTDVDGLRG